MSVAFVELVHVEFLDLSCDCEHKAKSKSRSYFNFLKSVHLFYLLGLEFSLLLLHMVLKMEEEVVDLDRVDKAGPLDEILRLLWKELE